MFPIVSEPEVRSLIATTDITSPALTDTVWVGSEQTTAAELEGAPIMQLSAVAVGVVRLTKLLLVFVLSATVPVADAPLMILPQFVGRL